MNAVKVAMYDIGQYAGPTLKALAAQGTEVTLYKYVDDAREASRIAASYDGLLLPGGTDINPARYGRPLKCCCGEVDDFRDDAEQLLLTAFVEAGKPVLAICHGLQLVNVSFGGTLYQDLPQEFGGELLPHRDLEHIGEGVHPIDIRSGTLLASVMGGGRLAVNSTHHQAVERVAGGFTVAATAPDGVIEAIECPEKHILCTQWHPERLCDSSSRQASLFQWFAGECARLRAGQTA